MRVGQILEGLQQVVGLGQPLDRATQAEQCPRFAQRCAGLQPIQERDDIAEGATNTSNRSAGLPERKAHSDLLGSLR